MPSDTIYTARGAAWEKGCGNSTVLRAIARGELRCTRAIGMYGCPTTRLIRASDLAKWFPNPVGHNEPTNTHTN